MYLCLDLSLKRTGYAIFKDSGKLLHANNIIPPKVDNFLKLHYVVKNIEKLFVFKHKQEKITHLIIEDLFLGVVGVKGLVLLARLSGGVINSWLNIQSTLPLLLTASATRKDIGIKGTSHKAIIQLYVLKNFTQCNIEQYQNSVNSSTSELTTILENLKLINHVTKETTKTEKIKIKKELSKQKKKARAKFKRQMDKISLLIEATTNYGEDVCDAIILGCAYQKIKY